MSAYSTNAKQILRGKDHIADCIDAETAALIVGALNGPAAMADHLDMEAARRPRARAFTQGIRYAANEIRARMHEQEG